MKLYIISGETSGDQHAADLIRALFSFDKDVVCRGLGGDASKAAGLELCMHQKEIAVMGFKEVVENLSKIRKALKLIKSDIKTFQPDAIVLIDYPGFNLRIAKFAHLHNIPVHYYIAPKVWAWKEKRILKIRKYVHRLYCILPFEEAYFKDKGVNAVYIGNPSKIKTDKYLSQHSREKQKSIALIPGSRKQEILTSLPLMLALKSKFPDYVFKVSQAPGFDAEFYHTIDADLQLEEDMYSLLSNSKIALVTSGTATLETALLGIPQIVCYKTSFITYSIAKYFVKLKFISLVNLILNKKAITELIQDDFNESNLIHEASLLLGDANRIESMESDYKELHSMLGSKNPSEILAKFLFQNQSNN